MSACRAPFFRSAIAALVAALGCGCNVVGNHQGYEPAQPIEYSHAIHAGEMKIPCLYCHWGAEKSRHAGVPSANICMNCHNQVKKDAPEILKLRRALAAKRPIRWAKVHRLPDFAYFNHARHVRGGVACQACHGTVERMVRVRWDQPMTMGWCLTCHRSSPAKPGPHGFAVKPPTDCGGCHY